MRFKTKDKIKVRDKKDGLIYDCTVVKTRNNQVMVHYIGWKKSRDEWLNSADPRIVSGSAGSSRTTSLEPESPPPLDRTSTEKEIDELYKSICSQPVGHVVEVHSLHQYDQPTNNKRKRSPDPDLTTIENNRKRSLITHPNEIEGVVSEDGVSQADRGSPRTVPASQLLGDQQLLLPPTTLCPPDASGTTAASLDLGNREVSACVPVSETNCGLCQISIPQSKVKCTTCDKIFHPDTMCTGLADQVISVLLSNTDGSLLYKCCFCRLSTNDDSAGRLQLAKIVGQLVKAIKSTVNPPSVPPRVVNDTAGSTSTRNDILSQVRELREREKRRDYVIIRGLQNITVPQVRLKVSSISDLLHIAPVELSDIQPVGNSNLFRAKISNEASRKQLLMKCHQLRNTEEFSHVYINRDLTFQQRQDLRERRAAATGQSSSTVVSRPNSIPVADARSRSGAGSGRFSCLPEVDLGNESLLSNHDIAINRGPSRGRGSGQGRGSARGRGLVQRRGVGPDRGAGRGNGSARDSIANQSSNVAFQSTQPRSSSASQTAVDGQLHSRLYYPENLPVTRDDISSINHIRRSSNM